jgi:hypothetical protein
LGYPFVANFVKAMDCELQVESQIGRGTVFYFSVHLPRSEKRLPHGAQLPDLQKEEYSPEAVRGIPDAYKKILLVDDAEDNRMVISAFLKAGSHQIIEVVNGVEAVEM